MTAEQYKEWFVGSHEWTERQRMNAATSREGQAFLKQFVEGIPGRLRELESLVRSTSGFEVWKVDWSIESFAQLGSWLERRARKRQLTDKEIDEEFTKLAPLIKYRDDFRHEVFDEWTQSVCLDIAIYACEMIRQHNPLLVWKRGWKKSSPSYNLPVLCFPNKNTKEPFECGIVFARWALDKPPWGKDLATTVRRWLKDAEGPGNRPDRSPPSPAVPQLIGQPVLTDCPRCGFSCDRVVIDRGTYCNHCGYLESLDGGMSNANTSST